MGSTFERAGLGRSLETTAHLATGTQSRANQDPEAEPSFAPYPLSVMSLIRRREAAVSETPLIGL